MVTPEEGVLFNYLVVGIHTCTFVLLCRLRVLCIVEPLYKGHLELSVLILSLIWRYPCTSTFQIKVIICGKNLIIIIMSLIYRVSFIGGSL